MKRTETDEQVTIYRDQYGDLWRFSDPDLPGEFRKGGEGPWLRTPFNQDTLAGVERAYGPLVVV